MNNPRELKKRKQDLISHLEQAKNYKAQTIKFLNNLQNKLNNNEIKESEFKYRLIQALKGKTPEEWISYYNELIKKYNDELISINTKLGETQERGFNANTILIVLFFLMLSFTGIILIKPQITGLVIYQQGEIINDTVTLNLPSNLTINESIVKINLNSQESQLSLSNFNTVENLVTVDLSKFNLIAENGTLTAQIIFNNSVIAETSLLIELQQTIQLPIEEILPIEEAKIDNKVEEELLENEKVRVILKKKSSINKNEADDFVKNKAKLNLKQNVDDFYAVEINKSELNNLKQSKEIDEIILDEQVTLFADESISLTNIDGVKAQGYSGQGKSVCILDTGINYNLFGLQLNNNVFGYDFVNQDNDPLDDNGHGTSVSNILLKVSPNAKIHAVKVINNNGTGYYSDVLAGLQYCMDNNVDVISLSIGAGLSSGYCNSDLVASKVNSAVDSGIFVAASAGNDGSSNSIRAPSCASKVTRVASSTKQDTISNLSNVFLNDLLAPGENINTLDLNGNNIIVSGTSYSVPFVSGGALLILEDRGLLPSELKYLLRSTSEIINYNNIPYNRLNLFNALINNKTNEPYNYDANQTQVKEEPFTVQQQYNWQQNNYSIRYNISGIAMGPWTVYNRSVATSSPPASNEVLDGSNDTAAECGQPNNLRQSDNSRCVQTLRATNQEGWIRFNFTIPLMKFYDEINMNITSVRIVLEGQSSDANAVSFVQYNRTSATTGSWNAFGATATTEATRTMTYRDRRVINQIISNITNQTILALHGNGHDSGDSIAVDFVEIEVNYTNYTLVNSDASFTFGPKINSTTGINQTTEDLNVIWMATDAENATFLFNVTWFTNNRTNFTTTSVSHPRDILNVTTLNKNNLTVGQNWSAMVNIFDGQFISRANTSELLIIAPENIKPNLTELVINSTTGTHTNYTNETIQVRFNASDANVADTLNYSIQWIRNNKTNFTLVNIVVSNPGTVVENLQPENTTRGDTWMAMVLVCDNNNGCNEYKNTTELLIRSTPPNNRTPVIINSTLNLQLNLTTENLQARVDINDTDTIDTLRYNITWLTEDRINFTLSKIAVNNPGTIVETLTHFNTTKGQNWSAQIVIYDESNASSAFINSTKLLILNSNATITQPAFNQTTFKDSQYINVSLVFSDDDQDANSVTFEWYRIVGATTGLIQRATTNSYLNGSNVSDTLSPSLTSANDQIIVQAFAFDGGRNSTLLNSTTLTIQSDNAAPNNPVNVTINSTSTAQTNLTTEDLRMNFWCDDSDVADTLTFHLTAFKNNTNQFQLQGSCNDPEYKSVVLTSPNNTKGYVWSFSVNVSDAAGAYSGYNSTLINLTILNSAPIVGNVTLDESDPISVIEGGNKTFRFSFVATDPDNFTDIVNLSAVANISRTGETIRYNDTFVNANDGGCNAVNNVGTNSKNFSCSINVVFYDGAGVWNLSVRINDTTGVFAQNITKNFTISELTALIISPTSITFPTVSIGGFNISASANLTITNTGNDDISGREATGETINITAITLVPSSGSTFIPISNFTIGQVNASGNFKGNFCDFSVNANVTRLQNKTDAAGFSNFTGAINGSAVLANANNNAHTLGICLIHVPNDLSASQNYSTLNSGAWTISIFFFKRRKDKLYEKNKNEINSLVKIQITNKLNNKEIINLINYEALMLVPISIFKNNSPLEALVKYLKENLNLSLNEIASLINRDPRTIWITYENAKKSIKKLEIRNKQLVPLNIFNNRKLSILENLVYYLQNKEISLNNIAKILNRNYKTIYTVYSRVKNKNSNVYK
ncbi:MAG: S8 family serine peptidase [Nanoarchaeota archaeon]